MPAGNHRTLKNIDAMWSTITFDGFSNQYKNDQKWQYGPLPENFNQPTKNKSEEIPSYEGMQNIIFSEEFNQFKKQTRLLIQQLQDTGDGTAQESFTDDTPDGPFSPTFAGLGGSAGLGSDTAGSDQTDPPCGKNASVKCCNCELAVKIIINMIFSGAKAANAGKAAADAAKAAIQKAKTSVISEVRTSLVNSGFTVLANLIQEIMQMLFEELGLGPNGGKVGGVVWWPPKAPGDPPVPESADPCLKALIKGLEKQPTTCPCVPLNICCGPEGGASMGSVGDGVCAERAAKEAGWPKESQAYEIWKKCNGYNMKQIAAYLACKLEPSVCSAFKKFTGNDSYCKPKDCIVWSKEVALFFSTLLIQIIASAGFNFADPLLSNPDLSKIMGNLISALIPALTTTAQDIFCKDIFKCDNCKCYLKSCTKHSDCCQDLAVAPGGGMSCNKGLCQFPSDLFSNSMGDKDGTADGGDPCANVPADLWKHNIGDEQCKSKKCNLSGNSVPTNRYVGDTGTIQDGTCELSEIGEGCSEDKNCKSGICVAGKCAVCRANETCGSGKYCKCAHGVGCDPSCEPTLSPGAACYTTGSTSACASGCCAPVGGVAGACVECQASGDWAGCSTLPSPPSGQFCDLTGRLQNKADNSAACTSDSVCKSGHCCGSSVLTCQACCDKNDCPGEEYCQVIANHDNKCVGKLDDGAFCTDNIQCDSGFCNGVGVGACDRKKGIGAPCGSDSVCESGHCCSGNCQACCTQTDCPGEYCQVIGGHDNKCVGKLDIGAFCTGDSQCASDFCNVNFCDTKKPEGTPCTSPSVCSSGNCFGFFCRPKGCSYGGPSCSGGYSCQNNQCVCPASDKASGCTRNHGGPGICRDGTWYYGCPSDDSWGCYDANAGEKCWNGKALYVCQQCGLTSHNSGKWLWAGLNAFDDTAICARTLSDTQIGVCGA